MRWLRRLFRRRPVPVFRVGDLVRYRGRAMAVSRMTGDAAELVWYDHHRVLHTAGWIPTEKLRG